MIMSVSIPSNDDKLIWGTPVGTLLLCLRDLVMDATNEVAFRAGHAYRVTSMHPIAEPPFVKLMDEQGQIHRLEAQDIREFFGR